MESLGDMDRIEEIPIIPEALSVHFDEIPDELQEYPFVFWRYEIVEKYVKKPPFNPRTGKRASVADPTTWGSFDEARNAYLTQQWGKADGVGIMLPENSNLVAVDIDDCTLHGKISASAMDIITSLDSYSEYSPSIKEGEQMPTGVHVWVKGTLPGLFCRNDDLKVEMYQRRRYMTVTGHPIHTNSGLISADQDRLSAVYNELFGYTEGERGTGGGAEGSAPRYYTYVSDEQALARAHRANYGSFFRRFYEGDASLWEGEGARYASQSNADFVLVLFLLRVTNNNTGQSDELFRRSGLMRPKWDRKVNKHETYGQHTIKRALDVRLRSQT